MKKVLLTFCCSIFCLSVLQSDLYAINKNGNYWASWGYDGGTGVSSSAGDFLIAGGVGKASTHGTHTDEWGGVAVIALKIVERGGYFCPYQIQCANKRKDKDTWSVYYLPNGYSDNKCAWLCEAGYSGENCIANTTTPAYCDQTQYNTQSGGKFSGLSMKTSGGSSGSVESNVTGFNTWYEDGHFERDVLLGVVKFLEHGVIAAPVRIACGRDNWPNNDSYLEDVYMASGAKQKLLCATGYQPNATGTDCEPINKDICDTQNMRFCDGFARDKYNSSIHTIKSVGDCVKYFCSESGKAFASATDTSCTDCATGSKGGASGINGTCVVCQTGQYFNEDTSACETAVAYSKTDLQYGKGKTKNTNSDVKNQCWTIVVPEDYVNCVKNGGQQTSTGN